MNTKYTTEAAPDCATQHESDGQTTANHERIVSPILTVRHLAKVHPEYHYNQYGDYETVKEYITDQIDVYTSDDLIKAWLVLDIFCDILGEYFMIPYGSPDPEKQARIIKELLIDTLLGEELI